MKHVTGLKKDLILVKNMRNKDLRRLPLNASWYLLRTFKNEKLTKIKT